MVCHKVLIKLDFGTPSDLDGLLLTRDRNAVVLGSIIAYVIPLGIRIDP